jgi:vacuolar-type H+-ATPase subunit I/STV1
MRGISIAIMAIAVIFGFIAAVMAYLISYMEYQRHYIDKRDAKRAAIKTGRFTFGFFIFLGIVLALLLPRFL